MPNTFKAYADFRYGLDTDSAPDLGADNCLRKADNVILDIRGGAAKRNGILHLNSIPFDGEVEQVFEWTKSTGAKLLMAVIGNSLCKVNDDGSYAVVQALNQNQIGWTQWQDKIIFVDGAELRQYDGSTVSAVVADSSVPGCDLAPIRKCKFFFRHPSSMRFFASGNPDAPATLYFSEPNNPAGWASSSKVNPTEGGPITALTIFGDAVLAFCANTIWSWRGSNPATDLRWSMLPVGQGTIAPKSIALTASSLTFLGQGGLYAISPAILDYNIVLSPGEELVPNLARDRVVNLVKGFVHPETACAVWDSYAERYYLAYGDDPGNPRNNKVLVLDWPIRAFTRFTGWQVNGFCLRSNGELVFGTNGYIERTGIGYSDNGNPINFSLQTKAYTLDAPLHRKKIRKIFIRAMQQDAESSNLVIDIDADYNQFKHSLSFTADLDESFVYGEEWGATWGWADTVLKEFKATGLKSNGIQITISNNLPDEPVVLYGVAFDYKLLKPKGVRS